MTEKAVKFFVRPSVPAFLAAIAPVLGALIAFRKDHIAHVFDPESPLPSYALLNGWGDLIIFVCLIGVLILGFACHKLAESIKSQQQLHELKTHTERLHEYLQTLPQQGFLEKYKEFYERSYKDIVVGLEDSAKTKKSIEVALSNLAVLASYFDDQRLPVGSASSRFDRGGSGRDNPQLCLACLRV